MSEVIGYARTSSIQQTNSLETQIKQLKDFGCTKIFAEQVSGKKRDREQLNRALEYVRDKDIFVVTRLDRCSRSASDLHEILKILRDKGVEFKATEQDIDTTTPAGKFMISIMGSMAEFETDLRAERQREGIEEAKKKGVRFGKKPINFTEEQLKEAIRLKEIEGETSKAVAEKFGVSRNTLLKKIREYRATIA